MKIHKFKPIKKKDTLLFKLLLVVAGLHAVALLILGGMVISEIIIQPETTFEAPPPVEKVEPKKQYQHKATQQNKSSAKLVKRIQIPQAKMNNVSTANIALPSSDIAGSSLSGGLAPKGFGDLNMTMTTVNLRGIEGKTEKIIIVIDASRYMMTDAKGALNTYNVIKKDITDLVNKLPGTVLFNVIAFSTPPPPKSGITLNAFNPAGMIPASVDNKEKLAKWLDPINKTLGDIDKMKSNYKLKTKFLPQAKSEHNRIKGGYDADVARIYMSYQAAVEQGADTIFFLTSNWTAPAKIRKPFTEADEKAYQAKAAKAKAAFDEKVAKANANVTAEDKAAKAAKAKEQLAARAKERAAAVEKAKAWLAAENAKRKKAGQSLNTSTIDQVINKQGFEKRIAVSRGPSFVPPARQNESYTGAEIAAYYSALLKKEIGDKAKLPTINFILFRGAKENIDSQTKIAEAWAKLHNNGKVKVLVGTNL